MSIGQVQEIGRDMLYTALLLSLPALGVSLVIGLIIAILQTITSIQEATLSFVPRILAVGLVIALTLSLSLQLAIHFTIRMFLRAAQTGA
jgi:flagellar biosynthetic protein FliQ